MASRRWGGMKSPAAPLRRPNRLARTRTPRIAPTMAVVKPSASRCFRPKTLMTPQGTP